MIAAVPSGEQAGLRLSSIAPAVAQIVAGGVLIVRGHGWSIAVIALLAVSGTCAVLLMARTALPYAVKATLTGLVLLELLVMCAGQDPLGIKAVNRKFGSAVAEAEQGARASRSSSRNGPGRVNIAMTAGSGADGALAGEVSRELAASLGSIGSGVRITGSATVSGGGATPYYSVTWSIVRNDVRKWCGTVSTEDAQRASAVTTLAQMIKQQLTFELEDGGVCT